MDECHDKEDIEHFLTAHPVIQSVAVVRVPDRESEIAPNKMPSEVRIIDTLPMTPTTKARKLREMALQDVGRP